ncbi:nidogen-like domain-containing protein [Solirubrum puertoriconensis]|uniref:Secretion system C-terminal sorting domain-containing protein n=1 Tax=Solirubrum puertoriconensis TaxID=1751427 RepID=A0A9X0L483_SOLP1|nr:nidogen-like domain-containing protein [Solirubrum puertoriconensis]KUG07328.1 hypothetical protein ASU33_13300 [Solirubrum puertoriconensis]
MLPTLRVLQQWLTVGLLAALPVASVLGQQTPRIWDPAKSDPQYNARKRQLAESLRGKYPALKPAPSSKPQVLGRTTATLPACAEPFDAANPAGWTQVDRGDDASLGPIPLGFSFQLFGNTYTEVYINTNGNITFNKLYPAFNSSGLPIREQGEEDIVMLAPFWADVDTDNPNSGAIWYRLFPDRLVVTYDRVGYYQQQADKVNTFQVIIRANTASSFSGDDVTFAYGDMQWTTASSSGGTGGFGGEGAIVGGNVGDQQNFFQFGRFNQAGSAPPNLPASNDPGGIDWLDNQCISFQVRSRNNPPAAVGLPPSSTITLNQGETRNLTAQFFGSEGNQNVTVTPSLGSLCNATANIANNNTAHPTLNFSVTAAPCNVGSNTVTFQVQDNGSPAQSQTYTVTVVVNPGAAANGTWTGAVSTAFNDPANWSNNVLPAATDNATIPAGVPRMPVLNTLAAVNNLTVANGASLTIADAGALTLTGNLANSGTISGGGTILTAGPSAQTLGGSSLITIGNLTVGAAGAQLTSPVAVTRLVTLTGNLASNGNLTLVSSGAGTAMIANVGTASVTGNATVQRFISGTQNPGPGYRHLSSPVSNTTVADLSTGSFAPVVNPAFNTAPVGTVVSPFPNVFFYDQSRVSSTGFGSVADFDRGWVSPSNTADPLVPGQGYTVNIAANQTLDFVGQPNNGTISRTGLGRTAEEQSGWHLLGNPYPSPIDWDVAYLGATNLSSTAYVFKSTGQYDPGRYASYNATTQVGTNGGTRIIPLGQGFFVRTSAVGATGSINFTNAARLTAFVDAPLERTTQTRTLLKISLNGSGSPDQVAVYFEAAATAGYDAAYDAYKLHSGGSMLALGNEGSNLLAMSALPVLGTEPITVPLLVYADKAGSYSLQIDELLNLPAGTSVQLRDALTGTSLELKPQTAYAFEAKAGSSGTRFSLLFTPGRPLATSKTQLATQVTVYPNPAHDKLWVRLPATKQAIQAVLFNALGQVVLRHTLPANRSAEAQAIALQKLPEGVYTLRLQIGNEVVAKRLVVQ